MHVYRAGAALLLSLIVAVAWRPPVAGADDPCEDPRNLTYNCQFDSFAPAPGGEVPQGWWPFVLMGHPAFDAASDTPKQPALRIWSDGEAFVAGVYQEIAGIQPAATYEAFIGWAVFQSEGPQMGRSIGIDPGGGTDPSAPSVVWSPEVWEKKRSNPELRVRAVAEGERITVFVRVNHPHTYGADQAFLDAVCLFRDEAVPLAEIAPAATTTPAPPPTATPLPPTATAVVVAPVATPLSTAEPSPAASETASPTEDPACGSATADPVERATARSDPLAAPQDAVGAAAQTAPAGWQDAEPMPTPYHAIEQPAAGAGSATPTRPPPTVWMIAHSPLVMTTSTANRVGLVRAEPGTDARRPPAWPYLVLGGLSLAGVGVLLMGGLWYRRLTR